MYAMDDSEKGLYRLRQGTSSLFDRENRLRGAIAEQLQAAIASLRTVGGFFGNEKARSAAAESIGRAFALLQDDAAFRDALRDIDSALSDYASSISRSANEQLRSTVEEIRHRVESEQKEMHARNHDLQRRLDDVMRLLEKERKTQASLPPPFEDVTIQGSLLFISASPAGDGLSIPRFVPYEVYVGSDDYQLAKNVHESFLGLITSQGFEPVPSLPVVLSSQRIRGVVKTEPVTRDQLDRMLAVQEGILRHLEELSTVSQAPVAKPKEDAEIAKLIAETEKIKLESQRSPLEGLKTKQEALKAGSETGKNIVEALDKLSGLLLKAGVAVSLLDMPPKTEPIETIGSLRLTCYPTLVQPKPEDLALAWRKWPVLAAVRVSSDSNENLR